MRYVSRRIYTWSPGIAYCVGLMASDGCLQKNGRHLDLTSVDIEQLTNFSVALGRTLTISRKVNQWQQPAFRTQFSDVAFYDFLLQVGLTPAKSKTLGTLIIPDELYCDFLRGLFDGDGSCNAYMDPRWRSSFMFYTRFCSASIEFINYLRTMNSRLAGLTAGSIQHGGRVYALSYAKADSHKLFKFMYYNDTVICLSRKRTKLLSFTVKDRPVIMAKI